MKDKSEQSNLFNDSGTFLILKFCSYRIVLFGQCKFILILKGVKAFFTIVKVEK